MKNDHPKIILTSSGMLTGGLSPMYFSHLSKNINNLLMIVGYQAQGTLGREIVEGKRSFILEESDVSWVGEVIVSSAFSAHADQQELLEWLSCMSIRKKVYLVHGEAESLQTMHTILGEGRGQIVDVGCEYEL